MADDPNQRPYRSSEPPARTAPGATPAPSSDPLAELARLIGQSDPFAEFGRDSEHRSAAQAAPVAPPAAPTYGSNDYYASAPVAPPQQPEASPYGAPVARQTYTSPSYTAGADPYRADNQAHGFPDAQAGGYQSNSYQPNAMHADEEDDIYDDIPPPRRRAGVMAIAAVFALAVIGTAGAFGYRALFGSSGSNLPPPVIKADTKPIKVVPANANKTPNKLITDRVSDHAQDEKLVSREEKPVEMNSNPLAAATPQNNAQQAPQGSEPIAGEPRKIHTITIRPEDLGSGGSQPGGAMATAPAPAAPPPRISGPSPIKPVAPRVATTAPVAITPEAPSRPAEPRAAPVERRAAAPARNANAPLSLNPNAVDEAPAPAPRAPAPMRTAAAAAPMPIAQATNAAPKPAAGGSGAYVQVSSQRSEAEAQAAFHSLQAKYPSQLGNRQPVIRKVELGEKGTYYRAMVGPLAGNEASTLCGGIKSAGGSCLIQRN
jgi:hypothetical protein